MFKFWLFITLLFSLITLPIAAKQATVNSVMQQVDSSDWRVVEAQNILKITLPTGAAYIELNPLLAPTHTKNIKRLAREGFYNGLNIYRFVEGFVAQGGDASGKKVPTQAKKSIPAEFYLTTKKPLAITELDHNDGYAAITGFLNGFAVAQNQHKTQTWQVHCNGIFAMARDNDINSGGTEFYVTIGHSPRYLDRNITVFGRVLEGMEHFNRLERKASGDTPFNLITDIQVLADISGQDNSQFKVMRTDSRVFKALIAARRNRSEAWFIATPNYIDVCAMPIPTERVKLNL
ncbi:peptidylprolyl isomerase [Pseudoalteromonas shioyasakiensis]|uniref:peptidylprolyl isomerase n=1 Tax=Pseudoalteromonas shioyasakiensis TaxID=1190813 RepID=UPI00211866AE|nr:peptidylprolyl isomerase [Pseudoalteromonas shioyasakiensis]MCQ8877673.1 peptidylprolyl isomerase [Pseudoalteromonas shioyasakiensis]